MCSSVVVPPFRACTDNAAMIAYAWLTRLARGEDDTDTLTTSAGRPGASSAGSRTEE
ncbi:MAG: hypothetical protein IPI67_33390 [Myxococcales bacterium]|nr:hypothetical protein [Myxococcales bacterium]